MCYPSIILLRFQSVGVVGVVERLTPKDLCFPTLKALLVADQAHPQEVVTRQYYARVYHENNVPWMSAIEDRFYL